MKVIIEADPATGAIGMSVEDIPNGLSNRLVIYPMLEVARDIVYAQSTKDEENRIQPVSVIPSFSGPMGRS